jgi:hypothetical protein
LRVFVAMKNEWSEIVVNLFIESISRTALTKSMKSTCQNNQWVALKKKGVTKDLFFFFFWTYRTSGMRQNEFRHSPYRTQVWFDDKCLPNREVSEMSD